MPFNFRGGIHPEDKKSKTFKKAIEEMDAPKEVVIPLLMHKGTMCSPIVEIGDRVKLGQKIGDSTAELSCPCHASVSGRVIAIEPRLHPTGERVLSVVIENDFADEREPVFPPLERFVMLGAPELSEIAREAGISGLGGSGYPLSEKIKMSADKVDTLIINGAECEPYITADERMMVEYTDELYDGAYITAQAIGAKDVVIAVESGKAGAIAELRRVLAKKPGVRMFILHTKYPQGAERQLIRSVTGREVPADKMPCDMGVMTMNVSTAIALSRAVHEGRPLTERVITVSGSAIANPKNLLVRIGTQVDALVSACGGFLEHPDKVIMGGPMMGMTQSTLCAPVTKRTNGVIAFCEGEGKKHEETTCIHCGKCVEACPMHLVPAYIYRAYKMNDISECAKYNVADCSECGCCAYVCPARISLVSVFRTIKTKLTENGASEEVRDED